VSTMAPRPQLPFDQFEAALIAGLDVLDPVDTSAAHVLSNAAAAGARVASVRSDRQGATITFAGIGEVFLAGASRPPLPGWRLSSVVASHIDLHSGVFDLYFVSGLRRNTHHHVAVDALRSLAGAPQAQPITRIW
jgi:hypothetical protein